MRKVIAFGLLLLAFPIIVAGFLFSVLAHAWLSGVELYKALWDGIT